jgi:hypothetical protein
MFVVLLEKLCYIIDEQLVVFVGEQFLVLGVLFAGVVIITSYFLLIYLGLFDLIDSIKVCECCLHQHCVL